MKNNLLLSFVYLVSTLVSAQNYQWEGAVFGHVNSSSSTVYRMAVSKSNQKAVVGQFKGSMQIGNHSLSSDKPLGLFLAKFAENDSLLWLKKIADSDEKTIETYIPIIGHKQILNFDSNGNLYLGFYYNSDIPNYELPLQMESNCSFCSSSIVLKFDLQGNHIASILPNTDCLFMINDFSIDSEDNVYVNSTVHNSNYSNPLIDTCSCIFDDTTLIVEIGNTVQSFVKYNQNLEPIWFTKDISSSGNIGIIGNSIYSSIVTSNVEINLGGLSFNYPSNYNQGAYVAKFDTSGVFKWARHFGVPNWASNIQMRDLLVASPNSIVVMGSAYSQLVPNKIYFENAATLHGNINGSEDAFVVCYDSLGNVKWYDMSNNNGGEWYAKGSSDASGTVFLGGTYTNDIVFGNDTLETSGGFDVFLRALDAQGQALWSKTITGAGSEFLYDMGTDSQNNLFLMGESSSAGISFGGSSYDLANDYRDFFIARLSPSFLALPERERGVVQVHPNPSSGRFTLRAESSIATVELYSLTGNLLLQQSYTAQNQVLLNKNLSTGAYLLRVLLANGQESVQKIMMN